MYSVILGKLAKLGFKDKRTKLILYDCYVRSILLFGSNIWGTRLLANNIPLHLDKEGKFGVFHRKCLRQLVELPRYVRNEVVYLLSA